MRSAATVKLPTIAPGNLPVARPRLPSADDILPYLRRIDDARWYSNFGPLLTELELRLASRFTDGAVATTVVNATQALTLTLQALDLPAGSLVATPSWTFVATAHAIAQAGLIPWFLDVDHASQMLDPATVREMLSRAPGPVSAVLPVAAHGAMPDLEDWLAFRDETGLPVLLDAAAAFDAARDARLPTVVSLHATKVLGLGEGGVLVTDDAALAARVRYMTTYGFKHSRDAQIPGTNAKLSEYTAAVGLAALDRWPADRLRFFLAAQHTRIGLAMTPSVVLQSGWGADWVTSVCVVRLPDDTAQAATDTLLAHGVETRRWWGQGCHLGAAFAGYPRTDLPVTDRLARSVIGLPFAIDLTREDVDRVVLALRATPRDRLMNAQKLAPRPHPVVEDFIADGAHLFDRPVDPTGAASLLDAIRADRHFDHRLFLTEAEFDADPQYTGVNPRPGRNLLERFEEKLGFVEQDAGIVAGVTALLGPGYSILNKKVVCGVSQSSVPAWIRERILGNPVNNLGAYVRPEYRDVTYFYGIDFHQDLIDYKDRPADFLTLYVYLHPVTRQDAPLFLLKGSHRLGGTVFPHDLTATSDASWTYRDRRGGAVETDQLILTGDAGFAAMWHACTLHGTQPDAADHERISLRYLLAQGPDRAGMDDVNATLQGPLVLNETRTDLAADGRAQVRRNTINQA